MLAPGIASHTGPNEQKKIAPLHIPQYCTTWVPWYSRCLQRLRLMLTEASIDALNEEAQVLLGSWLEKNSRQARDCLNMCLLA